MTDVLTDDNANAVLAASKASPGGVAAQRPLKAFGDGRKEPRTEGDRMKMMRRAIAQRQKMDRAQELRREQQEQELVAAWEAKMLKAREVKKERLQEQLSHIKGKTSAAPSHSASIAPSSATTSIAPSADQNGGRSHRFSLSGGASSTAKTALLEGVAGFDPLSGFNETTDASEKGKGKGTSVVTVAEYASTNDASVSRRLPRRPPKVGKAAWDQKVQGLTDKMQQDFPFHLFIQKLDDAEFYGKMMKLAKEGELEKRRGSKLRRRRLSFDIGRRDSKIDLELPSFHHMPENRVPMDPAQRLLARKYRLRMSRNVAEQVINCKRNMAVNLHGLDSQMEADMAAAADDRSDVMTFSLQQPCSARLHFSPSATRISAATSPRSIVPLSGWAYPTPR
jgi:hypothetical protein